MNSYKTYEIIRRDNIINTFTKKLKKLIMYRYPIAIVIHKNSEIEIKYSNEDEIEKIIKDRQKEILDWLENERREYGNTR